MPVIANTVTSDQVCTGLDVDFVESFTQEFSRLTEILGLFPAEQVAAGTAIYQYAVTGTLAESVPGEGEQTPLSSHTVDKVSIGDMAPERYAKLTTAESIIKSGFENAVLKTDRRFRSNLRSNVMSKFFTALEAGTGKASGANAQGAIAHANAALNTALENNGDETERIVNFVNHEDIADHLAAASITTQDAFGMTYLKDFLGASDMIATAKVPKGTVYAVPVENIHVYGLDFGSLAEAGLSYQTDEFGLIGIHHAPDYDRGSAETFAMVGMKVVPEAVNYIVKGTIAGE